MEATPIAYIGRVVLLAVALCGCVRPGGSDLEAQQPATLPSAKVWAPHWGLQDPADIRDGQVTLIDHSDGPRLAVNRLGLHVLPTIDGASLGYAHEPRDGTLIVDGFRGGNRNVLGGFFNVFEKTPSSGVASLDRSPDGRTALQLDCQKGEAGFCGVWVHLFDSSARPDRRRMLDVLGFATLSFWIRGQDGGERLNLRLADARWERLGDAITIGSVDEYLPARRIETEWQQVVVPVAALPPGLDRSTLATFSLEAVAEGRTRVYISTLAWARDPGSLPALPDIEPERPAGAAEAGPHKATWIWNTEELLEQPDRADALIRFLAADGFDRAFLQLPSHREYVGLPAEIGIERERVRPLIRSFSAAGLRVYALDGAPQYATPPYDEGVLRTVRNVAAYNEEVSPDERFFGVRYDIEPYLLPGFDGPRRESILHDLVDLAARMSKEASEAGLQFGLDIPFWYDEPSDRTHERITVAYGGVRKPVSHHLIDRVDDLAIMDYRTVAFGADGTLAHAEGELAYASARGKQVYLGLETFELFDETLLEFQGEPTVGLPPALAPGDFVVFTHSHGATAPDSTVVIYVPVGDDEQGEARRANLESTLAVHGANPAEVLVWPIERRVRVPADKLSFYALGEARLRMVMRQTARELRSEPSFAGFALHYAQTYRALVETSAAPEAQRR